MNHQEAVDSMNSEILGICWQCHSYYTIIHQYGYWSFCSRECVEAAAVTNPGERNPYTSPDILQKADIREKALSTLQSLKEP